MNMIHKYSTDKVHLLLAYLQTRSLVAKLTVSLSRVNITTWSDRYEITIIYFKQSEVVAAGNVLQLAACCFSNCAHGKSVIIFAVVDTII